ncbi:DUF523 domain-containing protein [Paraclostridium dentum]|uniref:DUF523 domain-containing protein n=1 Tax=Paraclostridium dentum TaxID=2662455 RepID=UPI003AFFB226
MILVSACLLGINCKYDGDNNNHEIVKKYLKGKQFVLVCPEQLGGLSTPRIPCEIENGNGFDVLSGKWKVKNKDGIDTTENFIKGAKEALKIAQLYNCSEAILKEGSPSCGSNKIYDGTFTGKKINGAGVTAAILKNQGIHIINEKDLEK